MALGDQRKSHDMTLSTTILAPAPGPQARTAMSKVVPLAYRRSAGRDPPRIGAQAEWSTLAETLWTALGEEGGKIGGKDHKLQCEQSGRGATQ